MADKTPTKKEVGPRSYTSRTLDRLRLLSYNQCSFPTCPVEFADVDSEIIVKNICHIEAAEENGPRWNPTMTNDQRRHYDNLILLCPNHHVITNDEKIYTVAVLKKMKRDHIEARRNHNRTSELVAKQPSILADVISLIASSDFLSSGEPLDARQEFEIEQKITYNEVIRSKATIEQYRVFQGKLTRIYAEIEKEGSNRKEAFLHLVQNFYLQAKASLVTGATRVQDVADDLMDSVESKLWEVIDKNSNNLSDGIDYEIRAVAIQIVMVDAFMRCKILEEPLAS